MFEELIGNLGACSRCDFGQDCGKCTLKSSETTFCCDVLLHEAADAIEALEIKAETFKSAYIAEHNARIDEIKRHMWIPVTERLPLLNTPVLATDGIEVDISWMYGVPPRWITSYTAIDEDKLTYWMPLPQTPKAEESE